MRTVINVTAAEAAEVLRRREMPFPGFVYAPDRQAAGLAQLREHFGDEPLRGPVLSEEQLVAAAVADAEAAERRADELEREVLRRTPLAERLDLGPEMRNVLGLSEQAAPEPPATYDRSQLGPEMLRVLRGAR